jgi:hypothetical protein
VNVFSVDCPEISFVEGADKVSDPDLSFSRALKRLPLRCHEYRSSVHRRRYSAFVAGDGRGGKLDLGNRSVDDHDARRTRVGASIIASRVGNWAHVAGVGGFDIFPSLSIGGRWIGD